MRFLFILVCGVLAMGCSLKKTADDVAKDSKALRENSEDLKRHSRHLADRTNDLEAEATLGTSTDMMLQNMRWVFGEAPIPVISQPEGNQPSILLYAGVVMKAMWFQYWNGDYEEDLNDLDRRFEVGAEILFTQAKTYIPFHPVVDLPRKAFVFPTQPDRSYLAVASIGAKLDFVRPEFVETTTRFGLGELTFYDLVMLALKNRAVVERTELFPYAVAKVLQYENEATFMVQLRHNYLPMMALASMTDFKDRSLWGRGEMWGAGVKVSLERFNSEQLKEWTRWLKAARVTREQLRRMGIQPLYNSGFTEILQGLDFGQTELLALPVGEIKGLKRLQYEFAKAFVEATQEAAGRAVTPMALPGDPGVKAAPLLSLEESPAH